MKRLIVLMAIAVLCVSVAQAQKKRVAVMDFEFGTVQRWWEGNWDIGKGISDMLVDELVNDGTYSVIERKQLETILAEQNFSNSDRANPSTAAQIGVVAGVGSIIVGSVTQFGVEKKGFSVGGIGGKIGGFGGGKVGTQKGKAKVAITTRMVDVNTAEIIASVKGEGKSSRSGLLLAGGGGGGGGFGAGGISMTSSDFRQTILGEATENAVKKVAEGLIERYDRVPEAPKMKVKGLVADATDGILILTVGATHGVSVGDELQIHRVQRVVKHPTTGEVLREITEQVGSCRVTSVDSESSVASLISGSGIKVGDIVKN
ncbi:MAG TPA: CsgG/HfaB family protein [Acidobacteriota bacterium]|nr:CsgG/HfaB family protein [Acidobacteriota bacterium]